MGPRPNDSVYLFDRSRCCSRVIMRHALISRHPPGRESCARTKLFARLLGNRRANRPGGSGGYPSYWRNQMKSAQPEFFAPIFADLGPRRADAFGNCLRQRIAGPLFHSAATSRVRGTERASAILAMTSRLGLRFPRSIPPT